MENAKEELLKEVDDYNLEILEIDCRYGDLPTKETLETLESLDFEYDNDYGTQLLHGTVYCKDKQTGEPVWLTRGEYDGSEWWKVNRVPQFYKKNNGRRIMDKTEYHIQMCDNGIVVAAPDFDMLECKEFNGDGGANDEGMCKFLGGLLWEDILCSINKEGSSSNIKLTISVEEDK